MMNACVRLLKKIVVSYPLIYPLLCCFYLDSAAAIYSILSGHSFVPVVDNNISAPSWLII